jgi:hypothetical protein
VDEAAGEPALGHREVLGDGGRSAAPSAGGSGVRRTSALAHRGIGPGGPPRKAIGVNQGLSPTSRSHYSRIRPGWWSQDDHRAGQVGCVRRAAQIRRARSRRPRERRRRRRAGSGGVALSSGADGPVGPRERRR